MKLSEKWLREWVNPDIDTATLVAKLTNAGLEVDAVEPVAGEFTGVLIGEVKSVQPHPDADKLRLTQVDIGEAELLDIVCGASNVCEGLKVPVATVGAVLPGNFKIKPAKLRGMPSHGMLCSTKELGLAESADGLMELAVDAPIGQDIRQYLDLDDSSIDIDLTPNRSDCLGVAGIAREVGVLTATDITPVSCAEVAASSNTVFPVEVTVDAACPRYLTRVISNINQNAATPVWMQEKLRRSGLRSISPVVDVTNYVMLELGQPMHAFDLDKLNGNIEVRMATNGETLTLLDGQDITLQSDTLLIADKDKPLALAGIMGGQDSGVTESSTNLLLEAAFFTPTIIAGKARNYGLHTDSSHRFERGVDPALAEQAIQRATQLLIDIVGGEVGPVTKVESTIELSAVASIHLREKRIERVLGMAFDAAKVEEHLTRLGLTLSKVADGWQVEVPSFRFDLTIEVDLIEELGRLYGYDNLPETRPNARLLTTNITEKQLALTRLQNTLIDRGYFEAITYSFVEPKIQELLAETDAAPIKLANPISNDLSVMRTSLWSGLVQALVYNANRQQDRVRFFEVGQVFLGDLDNLEQHQCIGGLAYGSRYPEHWSGKPKQLDFFDVKADVEALLTQGNGDIRFEAEQHPALHPGQTARIYKDGKAVGWLGALHPQLNKPLGIEGKVYLFELNLDMVLTANIPEFKILSKFPAIRRDLALVVDETVTMGEIDDCLRSVNSDILKSIQVFDVYVGEGVEAGKKSLALAFELQHNERTLTDNEVDTLMNDVMDILKKSISAIIRT